MRASTALSAGSWNGVKVPLRARISQAAASSEDREHARARPGERHRDPRGPLGQAVRPLVADARHSRHASARLVIAR